MNLRSRWLIGLIVLAPIGAMLIPVAVEADAKKSRRVQLDNSFWHCCTSLAQREIRDQLTSSGIQTDGESTFEMTTIQDPDKKKSSLKSTLQDLFAGKYRNTENFRILCDSELGKIDMELRQDTKLESSTLEVTTCSYKTGDKILNYTHLLRLEPQGETTEAKVELEIKVRALVPWVFKNQASKRLQSSLDKQLDSFVSTLVRLLEKKDN
jgi:hypothetical protein